MGMAYAMPITTIHNPYPETNPAMNQDPKNGQPNTSLLKFPCDFTIKVFGQATDEFEITVLSIIRKHYPHLSEGSIHSRASENGKYLALSITIHAESKEILDLIYQDLSSSSQVLMAL